MLAELLATEGVEEVHIRGGPVGIMALHGGLEEGTDGIARAVAVASGASLYAVVQPPSLWWHVPSIQYDPADSTALATFLNSVQVAISIHGFGEPGFEAAALLGGSNRSLARRLHAELSAKMIRSVVDLDAIPKRLHGTHPRNPVNRPAQGGVQIELAMQLRSGRDFDLVIDALVSGIETARQQQPGAAAGS